MAEQTRIAWTDHTFNPWIGCQRVAPGCEHCYAEAFAKRYHKAAWGPNGTRVKTSESYWRQPLKWNRESQGGVCVECGIPPYSNGFVVDCDCGQVGACHELRRPRVFCASLADVFEDWQGPIVDSKGRQIHTSHKHAGYWTFAAAWKFPVPGKEVWLIQVWMVMR